MEVSLTLKLILSPNRVLLRLFSFSANILSAKQCTSIGQEIKNSRLNWTGWIKRRANLVRKYLETIALFGEGLNLLRSAQLMNSLTFQMRATNLPRLNRCLLDFTARYMRGNVLKICERRRILQQTLLFNNIFRERTSIFRMIFTVENCSQFRFHFLASILITFNNQTIVDSKTNFVA